MSISSIALFTLLITLVSALEDNPERVKSSKTKNLVCTGINGFGQQISARCYHPDYSCSCVNNPREYPSCHCERNDTEQDTDNTETGGGGGVTWKPLYVVSIGGGVLLIVVMTSVACCCMCRQWYSRRGPHRGGANDKPPEYCDSPPPPYVHSSFYNTHQRPRTVQRGVGRISAGPSAPRLTTTPITPVEIPDITDSNARSNTAPNVARGRRQRGGSASEVYSEGGVILPGAVYRDTSFSDQSEVIMLPCYRNTLTDDIHVVDVDS